MESPKINEVYLILLAQLPDPFKLPKNLDCSVKTDHIMAK